MIIIGQLLWLCLLLFCLMIEDYAFVLMYHGETSQLICSADHLSGFYLVHSIERNIVILTGLLCLYLIGSFLSIVILTGLLCLYLIGSFLSVLFLYLTCYSFPAQGCAQLFLFKDAG